MRASDVPKKITIELSYHYKKALADAWRGEPENFDATNAFKSIIIKAENADLFKPARDREVHAEMLMEDFSERFKALVQIEAGWATGESRQFEEWMEQFTAAPEFVEQIIELGESGESDETKTYTVNPGGGSYGLNAYCIGLVVVAIDTEGNAWAFPPGTALPPDITNFEELEDY